jgi:hypothetical protein
MVYMYAGARSFRSVAEDEGETVAIIRKTFEKIERWRKRKGGKKK